MAANGGSLLLHLYRGFDALGAEHEPFAVDALRVQVDVLAADGLDVGMGAGGTLHRTAAANVAVCRHSQKR